MIVITGGMATYHTACRCFLQHKAKFATPDSLVYINWRLYSA